MILVSVIYALTAASFFFEAYDEALADDCDDAFLLSAFELDEVFFDDADENFDSLFFEAYDEALADDCDVKLVKHCHLQLMIISCMRLGQVLLELEGFPLREHLFP